MKRWAVIVVLALVLIAVGLVQQGHRDLEYTTTSPEAHALLEEGDMALFAFQWDKAMQSLERAVELDPDFAMARAALAYTYAAWGHPEEAEEEAALADSLAELLDDEDERMLVQLRLTRFHENRSARAESLLAILTEHKPDNLMVMAAQAGMAEGRGDRGEAEQLWRRVLEVNPNFAHAYNYLGYAAANRGSYDEAVDLLQKYTYLAPGLANPHDSLGEVLTYVGRYEEAEQEFRRALELQPDFYASLVNLARVYIARGQVAKGQEIMAMTGEQLADSEVYMRYLYLASRTYADFWMLEELDKTAARFIELYPDDHFAANMRIFKFTHDGNVKKARAIADSLAAYRRKEVYPRLNEYAQSVMESFRYRYEALFAHYAEQPAEEAAAWAISLEKAIFLAPHELISYRKPYALSLVALQRDQEALHQAREILQSNPRVIPALVVQAETLVALQKYEKASKAVDMLQKALERADPDYPAVARAASLRQELVGKVGD